ncbi:indolepyruvate ferredoxin oxidoreductase, beta subunit [Ferroglobus placidus DSM 10642]|uniref:Indolepyruvate ferredoxin oxidoreductase subunit beta n=1 Tax=Ferroglobus placidus (strain DSM 10642 / AEDII12DO) TaxID=589924 RepID=D3RXI3_FERPA|nr:indolepyruvate ferredoxin oxidoreductase subunit beta [Ferroglobus placidus]ADC65196.1 indolepyruvate ferredoxin oxidoreductase, beta subunit [Ferroglobus placidus DSM 10642]
MKLDILLVGVGGQGILTTSNILARAALKAGVNVVTAETHGMAQRGGSVEVHVRLGDVYAPLIPVGGADYAISLEPVEILRYTQYLNENTTVILNDRPIVPPSVSAGLGKYPEISEILETLRGITKNVKLVSASKIAEEVAGTIQATNVVVVGMLAKLADLPFDYEVLEEVVKEFFPEKLVEPNLKALKAGYNYWG